MNPPAIQWNDPRITPPPDRASHVLIRQFIKGSPCAQPRPRAAARRFGNVLRAMMYDSGKSDPWKNCIVLALNHLRPAVPWDGPLRLDLVFYFARPACRNRKKDPDGAIPHTSRPDCDNCYKAASDCIVRAGFIKDDALICSTRIEKYYCAKGAPSGVHLTLARWEAPTALVRMPC